MESYPEERGATARQECSRCPLLCLLQWSLLGASGKSDWVDHQSRDYTERTYRSIDAPEFPPRNPAHLPQIDEEIGFKK